ncbi:MAG: bifunctional N-acetylglucosamine-1-phosphate uridyltransferase/glucosamine-1-phosphate acetyltransferase [Acidimicrobiia bacterium]|jgi:bifunctional UDP-N-acetylglucosamine pyrophosphorylase/glucosamine-1-phosphate N-acetyltransferase
MDQSLDRPLSAIVLAAGHGTRMRSERPKPLHVLVGKPMVVWVLDALADCDVQRVSVVVGHGGEAVTKRLVEDAGDRPLEFVEQVEQRGTGDATAVGLTGLPEDWDEPHDVLVLTGDTPLLRPATIAALVQHHRETDAACTVLTARMADPTGYGRIVRGRDDRVVRIVEQADTTVDEAEIDEINTGIFCFRRGLLSPALRRIRPDNAQGELYLTDVVAVLADAGHKVTTLVAEDPDETHGINDRVQLAAAEAELRQRINHDWMRAGVTLVDPDQTYVDATVDLGRDVTVYPGTMLRGTCTIGEGAEIGPEAHLTDTVVGARARVSQTVTDRARIGDDAVVGPWAVLGPGDDIPSGHVTGPHYAGPGAPR